MPKTTIRTDKLRAAHDRLQEAVESITSGEDWQRMLKVASKFHRYSFNNQLMIFLQRPDATLVAGFRRWQELGRHVKRGEKGIAIFAPLRYRVSADASGGETQDLDSPSRRDRSAAKRERSKTEPHKGQKGIAIFAPCKYRTKIENDVPLENGPSAASPSGKGNDQSSSAVTASALAVEVAAPSGDRPKTEILRGFRVVYVFDISQTDGDDIPDLDAVRPKLLDGDAPEGIWDALVAQATAAGYEVVRTQKGNENGYCDFVSGRIGIRPELEDLQAVKTLTHELAHALLHGTEPRPPRDVAEVEVESVAFVVLDALGLASDGYSFPYIAQWAEGDVDVVKATADRVVTCARSILETLTPLNQRDRLPQDSAL